MDTNSIIIEYSRNPKNKYIMDDPTIRYRETNRICADVVEVFLCIENNAIIDFSFDGYMSIVATASSAVLGESIIGVDTDEILEWDGRIMDEIIGTDISPRRKNASLLPLLAIKNAIHTWKQDGIHEDFSDIIR